MNPQILSANDGCICSVKGEEGPKDGERVLPRDRKLGENPRKLLFCHLF